MPGAEQAHLDAVIRRMIGTYAESLSPDRRELLERYRYVHAARKVVGVGSVGARAWILLLLGRDDGDPLFLQFKEAQASVLEPFLGKSRFSQHGERIVAGQRMMQAAPDIMLGWERIEAIDGETKDFYIRQLWDAKGSAEIELMNPAGLSAYGAICGWTLARAHARSGDAVAISAYLGAGDSFDQAMAVFGETYADQNERDYQALLHAAKQIASPFSTDSDRRAASRLLGVFSGAVASTHAPGRATPFRVARDDDPLSRKAPLLSNLRESALHRERAKAARSRLVGRSRNTNRSSVEVMTTATPPIIVACTIARSALSAKNNM